MVQDLFSKPLEVLSHQGSSKTTEKKKEKRRTQRKKYFCKYEYFEKQKNFIFI